MIGLVRRHAGFVFIILAGGGLLALGALRSVDAMMAAVLLVGGVCSVAAVLANILDR